MDEKSGTIGLKSKTLDKFQMTPQPGQYLIANPSNWAVMCSLQDKINDEYDDEDNGDDEEDDHHALYRTLL